MTVGVENVAAVRSVEVLDLAGRRLEAAPVVGGRATLGALKSGLYVLRFVGVGVSRSTVVSVAR